MNTSVAPPVTPVSIPKAARWLSENCPEWAITEGQLRGLCYSRSVRCIVTKRASVQRCHSYKVRIAHVIADLKKMERRALA